ncbi:MAG: SLC13 family permease [Polyangiales bacterium]
MSWQAKLTLALTFANLLAMAWNVATPDVLFLGQLVVLVAVGILAPEEAIKGFADKGVFTVGLLFVVAASVRETGAIHLVANRMLGRPKTVAGAQARMMFPVAFASTFLNNTPIVAVLLPVVSEWGRQIRISPSKLLIPLSYATILGGTCSLIGTSTNLVVARLASERAPDVHLHLFDLAWVGVPVAIIGLVYILVASRWLLPARDSLDENVSSAREYTVAMRVGEGSPIVGKTIEEAGLRHLPGLYLIEIERKGEVMPAVSPDTRLAGGDELLFAGVVDSVADLTKVRGLEPANGVVSRLTHRREERQLVEAVVARESPFVGQSVRDAKFRTRYNAAILSVHRHGERIEKKIGDIQLEAGDTLLLEAHPSFVSAYRNDRTFSLVNGVENSTPPRYRKAWIAGLVLISVVGLGTFEVLDLMVASAIGVAVLLATRCITVPEMRSAVDAPVLVTIAASFAIGKALETTGAAAALASLIVDVAEPYGQVGLLSAIYVATTFLNAFVSNNASVALMFPIAAECLEGTHLPLRALIFLLMMAGSADFSTPIGYQTNLMVYGPGKYRFADFLRIGIPLQILAAIVNIACVVARWGHT